MTAAPNPSVAQARVLIDELVRNGVRQFVIAPGSRSASLAMAALDHPRARVFVEIDERSAGFLALGMGRASGEPAVVITTSGTAVANLTPAAVEAEMGRVPLLMVTADRPPELRGVGANQTIDQIKLLPVRWFCEVGVAEDRDTSNAYWRSTVCRALAEAKGTIGAPGAVHLNVACREPLVPASDDGRSVASPFISDLDGRPDGRPWTAASGRQYTEQELPPEVIEVEKGLVVAGEGHPDSLRRAEEAAARLGWPLIAEATAGGRPSQAISTAHHLFATSDERIRPDIALVFGRVGLSRHLSTALRGVPRWVVDPGRWTDPDRSAAGILQQWPLIVGTVERRSGWRRMLLELERVGRAALDAAIDQASELTEPRIARDVSLLVPEGGTLFVGSSMPIRDIDWFMPPREINLMANRGASGVDGWVSSALGVAALSPGPVVALGGDLSLLHDSNGFLVSNRPDCVFVVVNNDGGGIFSFLPQAQFRNFEEAFATPHGRDLATLASFHEISYDLVATADGLSQTLPRVLDARGVHLIEVRTDRQRNVEVHHQLTKAVTTAVERHLAEAGSG